jgi:hypothetical protein
MTDPRPYDHVRASEDEAIPAGTYRVVGTDEEIALLRVGDEEGRRETTGEVVRVNRSTYGTFETAENPDSGFSLGSLFASVGALASAIRYWLPF